MNRSLTNLQATDTYFHGIISGKPAVPLGRVSLDVVFGNTANFRKERIDFEVLDWKSQYHMLLGRPALARFMAIPYYAYLMMKMRGPYGIITIRGSFTRSDNYDREFHKLAEPFGKQAELTSLKETTDNDVLPMTKKAPQQMEFSTKSDTTEHQVHPTDPSKTVLVSSSLPAA
ncbi:uncharacterized protein LOC104583193 [Brachypodium distachyon]|uniref:uncharacterized protein LOC104583193 n=1 Tax=Brachypodium distachyon TaxID=15368 RepID=UPI00052FF731|nr:uncharacterized protein LOC104583193 [Brachypodium distachyon]|eukprot:XP_010233280.1 uncharacterized protein LOC104583193 [Brachypodium distachyon]